MRPISSGFSAWPIAGRSSRMRFTRRSSAAVPARSIPAGEGRRRRPTITRMIAPGGSLAVRTRFTHDALDDPFGDFDSIVERRMAETDEFYRSIQPQGWTTTSGVFSARRMPGCSGPSSSIITASSSGSTATRPVRSRRRSGGTGATRSGSTSTTSTCLSVPDKWEYPWFAAWDTAFHCIVLARLDPEWAKRQVVLLLREWYMHPSGQLPAYEWDFSDANPPVHAHAARRVYEITPRR